MRDALAALRIRPFRMLFAGQAVSFVGDAIFPVALAFAVLDELDGTAGQLGLVLAAGAIGTRTTLTLAGLTVMALCLACLAVGDARFDLLAGC